MLPARPPPMNANPMNKNSLACHTIPGSCPNMPCPTNRSLLIIFTTSSPSVEHIPGIQSKNVTCTGIVSYGASGGGWAWADTIAASQNIQCARANWSLNKGQISTVFLCRVIEMATYQASSDVYPYGPFMLCEWERGA